MAKVDGSGTKILCSTIFHYFGDQRIYTLNSHDVLLFADSLNLKQFAVERIWHTCDSQGQILALTFRQKSLKPSEWFRVRSTAVRPLASAHTPSMR